MATITATDMTGPGSRTVTEVTLDGSSDTFTYNESKTPVLVMRNDTAGALTPVIDGDGGTTVNVKGIGSVDVSAGYTSDEIAAGAVASIPLKSIAEYLRGTITISSGTGLVCSLLEF